jgi:peptide/nickel transport system substrate-binding protein
MERERLFEQDVRRHADQGGGIIDLEARKKVVAELEKIMQEDGPIIQPLWRASYQPFIKKLQNYHPHPTEYYFFEDTWMA